MGDLFANGGSSGYPSAIDTATTQTNAEPQLPFDSTSAHASKPNNLASAIINVETALGTNPTLPQLNVGLTGANNSGTPTTQYDFAANMISLWRVAAGSGQTHVVLTNTGTITNNVSTAGPAANGRDQAGAFSANSFIHFYWIWNGATLATVSSATAPPTGPTLPTGYTHWGYICAIRFNGSSQLFNTRVRGSRVYYNTAQNILANGTATTETAITISGLVPTNAADYTVSSQYLYGTGDGAGDLNLIATLRVATTVDYITRFPQVYTTGMTATSDLLVSGGALTLPYTGSLFYVITQTTGTVQGYQVDLHDYGLPNGGS